MCPPRFGRKSVPKDITNLLVSGGSQAFDFGQLIIRIIVPPSNVPDMNVHRDRVLLLKGEERHAIGYLASDATKLAQFRLYF
mmetsp:Transcript_34995/g.97697  ORF Transcript_34995/g.97697 Transcript_34995/m.97697 type:complete len:82 (-) Transcript_34995:17-262(-)